MRHCKLVLTDSGGVQEEAPSLGKPVLVMRDTTERPEGVKMGISLVSAATSTLGLRIHSYGDREKFESALDGIEASGR